MHFFILIRRIVLVKYMTHLQKLIIWLLISILAIYALRMGIIDGIDQYVYNIRNTHFPFFAYRYDDYLPYLPVVIMFGLKGAGVKSRNSWKEMIVSTVFSFVLVGIVVLSMKSLCGVIRPDGSDFLSFPSGHTATVFTAAGVLRKEYGYKSKWIAAVIYLPAVITGLTRPLNNRHWLSDVMAGAIIGTMMVEAGYYLAGLLLKNQVDKK